MKTSKIILKSENWKNYTNHILKIEILFVELNTLTSSGLIYTYTFNHCATESK